MLSTQLSVSSQRGTTLVELLIVLGLMGIMVAGAVPGVHRIQQEWLLWSGVRIVESSLQWGRMHAIAANDSLALIVDVRGQCIYWQDAVGIRLENSIRCLPNPVRITRSPGHPLRFYEHGNAVPAGTYVIQGDAGSYRVIVSILGRIRVQRD